jgi:hypothetical protein
MAPAPLVVASPHNLPGTRGAQTLQGGVRSTLGRIETADSLLDIYLLFRKCIGHMPSYLAPLRHVREIYNCVPLTFLKIVAEQRVCERFAMMEIFVSATRVATGDVLLKHVAQIM